MNNIRLLIEYDGTGYHGWQKQIGYNTIQEELQKAIFEVTKEKVEVVGCSRTDAGVHAKGYVCNFISNSKIPANRYREALNTKLPNDIVVLESDLVDEKFHSRYNAKGKTYCYRIYNNFVPTALNSRYTYHYKGLLNIQAMQEAASYFIGIHDFKAFRSSGSSAKTTVRTISELTIIKNDSLIEVFITGDGFLYNMVRIIVGTLLLVGRNKIEPCYIKDIILSKDRAKAGKCVSGKGLILQEVYY